MIYKHALITAHDKRVSEQTVKICGVLCRVGLPCPAALANISGGQKWNPALTVGNGTFVHGLFTHAFVVITAMLFYEVLVFLNFQNKNR